MICAALCWFRETPERLTRCVESLAGVVDCLVAYDGAWELFPDASPGGSGHEEQAAIHTAARTAGIQAEVFAPLFVYKSQVAKRAAMMARAAYYGKWLLVVDADEHVTYADPDAIRQALEHTDAVIGDVTLTNLNQGEQMPYSHPSGGLTRRFYRAGTTVDIVHSGYFYRGAPLYAHEPAVDLTAHLHLAHDNCNRGTERNEQARQYRRLRQTTGVEVWA